MGDHGQDLYGTPAITEKILFLQPPYKLRLGLGGKEVLVLDMGCSDFSGLQSPQFSMLGVPWRQLTVARLGERPT